MFKLIGWKETTFSVLILGENQLLIGLSIAMVVPFFLSDINLSIFLPINPAIYRIGNAPNILCPRCKEVSLQPPPPILPFIVRFPKLI